MEEKIQRTFKEDKILQTHQKNMKFFKEKVRKALQADFFKLYKNNHINISNLNKCLKEKCKKYLVEETIFDKNANANVEKDSKYVPCTFLDVHHLRLLSTDSSGKKSAKVMLRY